MGHVTIYIRSQGYSQGPSFVKLSPGRNLAVNYGS
jgi:hypothetical protein